MATDNKKSNMKKIKETETLGTSTYTGGNLLDNFLFLFFLNQIFINDQL